MMVYHICKKDIIAWAFVLNVEGINFHFPRVNSHFFRGLSQFLTSEYFSELILRYSTRFLRNRLFLVANINFMIKVILSLPFYLLDYYKCFDSECLFPLIIHIILLFFIL